MNAKWENIVPTQPSISVVRVQRTLTMMNWLRNILTPARHAQPTPNHIQDPENPLHVSVLPDSITMSASVIHQDITALDVERGNTKHPEIHHSVSSVPLDCTVKPQKQQHPLYVNSVLTGAILCKKEPLSAHLAPQAPIRTPASLK